jgi:hypothetical protein
MLLSFSRSGILQMGIQQLVGVSFAPRRFSFVLQ